MRLMVFQNKVAEALAIYRSGADSAAAKKGVQVPDLHNMEHNRRFEVLLEAERLFRSNAGWY